MSASAAKAARWRHGLPILAAKGRFEGRAQFTRPRQGKIRDGGPARQPQQTGPRAGGGRKGSLSEFRSTAGASAPGPLWNGPDPSHAAPEPRMFRPAPVARPRRRSSPLASPPPVGHIDASSRHAAALARTERPEAISMARLFRHENRQRSERSRRFYAATELAYTAVDFSAAMAFLVGSILFFWKSLETAAICFFVIGSALFALKPTIRLFREIRLAAMGDTEDLAQRR
jgi:YrhK-like protein